MRALATSTKPVGNEREKLTHPERVKLTHLGLQNDRSGQERSSRLTRLSDPPSFFIDSRKRYLSPFLSKLCVSWVRRSQSAVAIRLEMGSYAQPDLSALAGPTRGFQRAARAN